jgi:CRISPR-associated endonuclease Csn1
MKLLGLDIGSNSVGSVWVDTDKKLIQMGDSVFPAGIEESDTKRGAPKNQARREKRSQRRSIERRAERKHQIRTFLLKRGWMPREGEREKKWLEESNPWVLRKEGLYRELTQYEFGRVILHLVQRRGAYGFGIDEEEEDTGKIKDAISNTRKAMKVAGAETFGEFMAMKFEERKREIGVRRKIVRGAIRNRTKATGDGTYEFCADRDLIWEEFENLWKKQKSFGGELSKQLSDECRKELDNPESDATWRYKGVLFGQRKTYWDVGTMARCDLEPTDMKCPKADMYAQEFLVLEMVNNIRITARGELKRALTREEREKVIGALEKQKTASEATIRKAMGIDKGEKKGDYTLSLEKDPKRGLNTNWFRREILGAVGVETWESMDDRKRESINRAILKFDPQEKNDVKLLTEGCHKWWAFDEGQTERFIEEWKKRSKVDDRVNYSRKAIMNLLPYLREGFTVNEARQRFAEDAANGATDAQRERYSFGARAGNRRVRRYIEKHADLLPPAPEDISNPVVRKAIHEVRRHIQAYIRKFGCKPERVVVELAREARQSAVVRNRQLAENRSREAKRRDVVEEIRKYVNWEELSKTQQEKAVKRVLLCKEQKYHCAYCDNDNDTITDGLAAKGEGVELDHIVPESRGGDNGLNNLVVCHTKCNRGKGNRTPREWFTDEQFSRLEHRLGHLKQENERKWDNLHKEVADLNGFVESQLTDTAYASRQVVGWLEKTLYADRNDGKRHVFTTKGRYTAILRRDWGLFPGDKEEDATYKNRADHRHHSIDAVVIALSGPERLSQLARAAEAVEIESVGKREPITPPWGDFDSFRGDVVKKWKNLIVAHRPESRKVTGSLHNDTQYGLVVDEKGKSTGEFTVRKFAVALTPNHLRIPKGWEELRVKLEICHSKRDQREIRKEMLALPDVAGGKSGLIRDRWFREELRECLRKEGLDPDNFSSKQIKYLIKIKGLFLKSGVPVRRVTLIRKPTVIEIKRKRWNPNTGKMEHDPYPRSGRYYEPQNNHHIEIRENTKGKWIGEVITTFKAAQRVRPANSSMQRPQSAVNHEDAKDSKFVMSLSIGEMVYMKHPETGKADYFVVFKIDGTGTVHFAPHWDAGRAEAKEKYPAREDVNGGLTAGQLQELGAEQGKSPQKVWVGPLGDVKVLRRD